jgi:3-isopropylmalate dehydrogenase
VDAIFLGAIGGPKWDKNPAELRPEAGILKLRKDLKLFANIRPLVLFEELKNASPLKNDRLEAVDFVIIRELTGGIYFGEKKEGVDYAEDLCSYSRKEVERITHVACEFAMQRKKQITSVDKANVLATSRLWRAVVTSYIEKNYPEIKIEHQLVDSAAMKLVQNPADFDVILTENMFGDILSDEASVISGSLGVLPSASYGESGVKLYEPIHGSAPDIAGLGIANPIASVLSIALMMRQSFKKEAIAKAIEDACEKTIEAGILTPDLNPNSNFSSNDVLKSLLSYI